MKHTLCASAVLAMVSAVWAQAPVPVKTPKHKVVFQMNLPSADAWADLYGNVRNIQRSFGVDNIQVEVVFFGKGISALLKTNTAFEERFKTLSDTGVVLAACENSMLVMHVTTKDLFPFAKKVDSGVAELVRKQEAGWSYVRAGE